MARERGSTTPELVSVDAYTTCVCFAGSKSLSHLLSYVERCKEHLLAMSAAGEEAKQQIVASVMAYWSEKPGTGISIVDKLLNYTILSPSSVIQWVFADTSHRIENLTKAHVFELVTGTIQKVANRVRQIVRARQGKSLPAEQLSLLEETLSKEQAQMRDLFDLLETRLEEIRDSSPVGTFDQIPQGNEWLRRWLRVVQRKRQVEGIWERQETFSWSREDVNMGNGHAEELSGH